jgi:hypothetical protein
MSYVSMGDILCFEGDGKIGDTLVAQLKTIYANAPSSVQSRYRGAYQAVVDSYNKAAEEWRLPFDPVNCQIKGIGLQAQDLAQKISVDSGSGALPNANVGGSVTDVITGVVNKTGDAADAIGQVGKFALWGAVLLGGAYVYLNYFKKKGA